MESKSSQELTQEKPIISNSFISCSDETYSQCKIKTKLTFFPYLFLFLNFFFFTKLPFLFYFPF